MPNDLTWNNVKNNRVGNFGIDYEPNSNPNVQGEGGRIIISVPVTVADGLDAGGVILFAHNFLASCNKAQNIINAGLPTGQGQRLASFPNSTLAAPTTDANNNTRATSTQSLITRMRVSSDSNMGNVV